EETLRGIPAGDDIQSIGTFELTPFQPGCKYLSKSIPFGIDLSSGCVGGHIKPPTAVELTAERLRAEYPYGPGPFYVRKHVGIVVNDPCLAVQVAAVEGVSYFGFQSGKALLDYPVEVDQLAVGVVDDLNLGGALGKEDGCTPDERFAVECVARYERDDARGEFLLATVVADGSL